MLCSIQRVVPWLPLRFLLLMYSITFLLYLELILIFLFLENHPFCLDFHISWFIVFLSFLILMTHGFPIIFYNQNCQRLVSFMPDLHKKQLITLLITSVSLLNFFISVIINYMDTFWLGFYFWWFLFYVFEM